MPQLPELVRERGRERERKIKNQAKYYTSEITKVAFHWKMPLKVLWEMPAKVCWTSDNPSESTRYTYNDTNNDDNNK